MNGGADDPGSARAFGAASATPPSAAEAAQRAHYNRIAARYEAHYDHPATRRYRERFIEAPLLDGLDLSGREVLEAMCGSGLTTPGLLARGARVTGLDISEACIESFRARWPQCRAVCASISNSGLASESFDAVVVVGGLHHLQPDIDPAIDEIHRLLRFGGAFCFVEPHTGSLPDWFRQGWYKRDSLFMRNEASVDVERLKARNAGRFEFTQELYSGSLGFLLVYNSMVFRIPLWLKDWYTSPVLRLESLIGRLQGKRSACLVIARWRKT
jgi:SAM-dependent methyltransferase